MKGRMDDGTDPICNISIANSTFQRNFLFSDLRGMGGSFYSIFCNVSMNDTVFKNNSITGMNDHSDDLGSIIGGAAVINGSRSVTLGPGLRFENNFLYVEAPKKNLLKNNAFGGALTISGANLVNINGVVFADNNISAECFRDGMTWNGEEVGGGALRLAYVGQATIQNSNFAGNSLRACRRSSGGAVSSTGNTDLHVNSTIFSKNYVLATIFSDSPLPIIASGNALHSTPDSNATIRKSTFEFNSAKAEYNASGATPVNTFSAFGGAVSAFNVIVRDCNFDRNLVVGLFARGGALRIGVPSVVQSEIAGSHFSSNGVVLANVSERREIPSFPGSTASYLSGGGAITFEVHRVLFAHVLHF